MYICQNKQQQNPNTMKKEFQIFKKGVTETFTTIVSKEGEPFDREAKIAKYKALGYEVRNMEGKKI